MSDQPNRPRPPYVPTAEEKLGSVLVGSALAGMPEPSPRELARLRAVIDGTMTGDQARAEIYAELGLENPDAPTHLG